MLREVLKSEYDQVLEFIKEDSARNYFIRLGLESPKPIYEKIIGEWSKDSRLKGVLFQRKSKNLQFYGKSDFDISGFSDYICRMDFKALISPSSYCDCFLKEGTFTSYKEGAFIAELTHKDHEDIYEDMAEVESLNLNQLEEVVELYQRVFTGFTSKAIMEDKINKGRGRGVYIRKKGKLVSVAQSEFEMKTSAVIVGVATHPDYQGRGLASRCLRSLCGQLLKEGKDLYLQYDNKDAGRLYRKLGFVPIDQVKHYIK